VQSGEIFYVVNVEAVVTDGERYLMAVRSEQEEHAPGGLTFPGGKVESAGASNHILEETARREVREETGVEVDPQLTYLWSSAFTAANGWPVVDVVFLCRYQSGEPAALQPEEISDVRWMTAEEIFTQPALAPWTRYSIERAEEDRQKTADG
jgi:8-oxo-dGTP diphosphatase